MFTITIKSGHHIHKRTFSGLWTPFPELNPINRFCHSLCLDLHMAFELGHGKYFCRHIANSRSHSHNWCEQELRSVFRVFPGTDLELLFLRLNFKMQSRFNMNQLLAKFPAGSNCIFASVRIPKMNYMENGCAICNDIQML